MIVLRLGSRGTQKRCDSRSRSRNHTSIEEDSFRRVVRAGGLIETSDVVDDVLDNIVTQQILRMVSRRENPAQTPTSGDESMRMPRVPACLCGCRHPPPSLTNRRVYYRLTAGRNFFWLEL